MSSIPDTVFLFDVDNTLLDNDHIQADLSQHLATHFGPAVRDRFWVVFEQLRAELGYADYLGTLERYRLEAMHDPRLLRISNWLIDYPFRDRLYPQVPEVIKAAQQAGTAVILSDGDAVFQPRKIEKSGLWKMFGENVLIYIHKELELPDVETHFPARHYVMIDDKLRILHAMKQVWGNRVTTVFPRQGHYATDRKQLAAFPPADVTVEHIGDLIQHDLKSISKR